MDCITGQAKSAIRFQASFDYYGTYISSRLVYASVSILHQNQHGPSHTTCIHMRWYIRFQNIERANERDSHFRSS